MGFGYGFRSFSDWKWGVGCGVCYLLFGVRVSGFGFGFRVCDLSFQVSDFLFRFRIGFEFRVCDLRVRNTVSRFKFRASCFVLRALPDFGFRVSGSRFRSPGSGFRVGGHHLEVIESQTRDGDNFQNLRSTPRTKCNLNPLRATNPHDSTKLVMFDSRITFAQNEIRPDENYNFQTTHPIL